jgi:2-polyprenyl-3-methyl-5-hydroxy-6-metoxy-1,4-benzoquinol methylase
LSISVRLIAGDSAYNAAPSAPASANPAESMNASSDKFVEYYASESLSDETLDRFSGIKRAVEHSARLFGMSPARWNVADVGCGAGTQCAMWARDGHTVHGIDINPDLIALGRERAAAEGLSVELGVASATELPWPNASMDVCLCPELLEHVADWERCLEEAVRVVRPGGIVYLSTTNRLCPIQQEFNLPAYGWYPARLKRHYERLAMSTRPDLANHAKYPAVNWFTYYQLSDYLAARGFRCLDRFDIAAAADHGRLRNTILAAITLAKPLRLLAHVATPGTTVLAQKVR